MRCFLLSEELSSTWVFDVFVAREVLQDMSVYICVEQQALEHIIYENLFVEHEALKHIIDEMFFVEQGTLEHMGI